MRAAPRWQCWILGFLLLLGSSAAAAWEIEVVDPGPAEQATDLVLDAQGRYHVAYYDHTSADLKYAVSSPEGWRITRVDSQGRIGGFNALGLAVTTDGLPRISYWDSGNQDLRFAWLDKAGWHRETVDSQGSVGAHNDLALGPFGRAHILYLDGSAADLKYARQTESGRWRIETVESDGAVGWDPSVVLDGSGVPHAAYARYTGGRFALKYATRERIGWVNRVLDEQGDCGSLSSIRLDSRGRPHISYYGISDRSLRYAHWDGHGWRCRTVDDRGAVGENSSLALDGRDRPFISYFDHGNGDLKLAVRSNGGWSIQTIDSEGVVGWYDSLVLDEQDRPRISYIDRTRGALKMAWLELVEPSSPPVAMAPAGAPSEPLRPIRPLVVNQRGPSSGSDPVRTSPEIQRVTGPSLISFSAAADSNRVRLEWLVRDDPEQVIGLTLRGETPEGPWQTVLAKSVVQSEAGLLRYRLEDREVEPDRLYFYRMGATSTWAPEPEDLVVSVRPGPGARGAPSLRLSTDPGPLGPGDLITLKSRLEPGAEVRSVRMSTWLALPGQVPAPLSDPTELEITPGQEQIRILLEHRLQDIEPTGWYRALGVLHSPENGSVLSSSMVLWEVRRDRTSTPG